MRTVFQPRLHAVATQISGPAGNRKVAIALGVTASNLESDSQLYCELFHFGTQAV